MEKIIIRGAKTHNLKNVNAELPRNRLVVITGPSGSGKSSLAFDTLYAEGQRRYLEGLSPYARQFLNIRNKPDVDSIEGLSPAIAIDQKNRSDNPRSTVGSSTEILDYLRLLYSRVGTPYCPDHHLPLEATPVSIIAERLLAWPEETPVILLSPIPADRRANPKQLLADLARQGFLRVRIGSDIVETEEASPDALADLSLRADIVVDRLKLRKSSRGRLTESLDLASRLSGGRVSAMNHRTREETAFSTNFSCPLCDFSLKKLEPGLFSPQTARGRCPTCGGTGTVPAVSIESIIHPELSLRAGAIPNWGENSPKHFALLEAAANRASVSLDTPWEELSGKDRQFMLQGDPDQPEFPGIESLITEEAETLSKADREKLLGPLLKEKTCPDCKGEKLSREARNVFLTSEGKLFSYPSLLRMPISELEPLLGSLELGETARAVADRILPPILDRLRYLNSVGLAYLTLDRPVTTLSGGESQRIRLACELSSGLSGVMYVLDEPSTGLHPADNEKLLDSLKRLRDAGNSVIVVEHDEDTIRSADYLIDMGPGSGESGGEVIASGTLKEILKDPKSVTGTYLSHPETTVQRNRSRRIGKKLLIKGARGHNLKNVSASIPVGCLTVVSGVSGSGKSSLINGTLYPALAAKLYRASASPLPVDAIEGLEHFDKVICIDQQPLGRTSRSNPATYMGIFQGIREIFAGTALALERGYGADRFSFNVKGGQCEACQGEGILKIGLQFLPDMQVPCDVCGGTRYNQETLEVRYQGKNIAEILDLSVDQAIPVFANHPAILRKLEALEAVGLGYIRLGQSSQTFSGGEAQRVKIAIELAKTDTGRTLYLLDEPTSGLHFREISQLIALLQKICDAGNTVVVIEHDMNVVASADWVIDMGPGGEDGGRILCEGTPEDIAACPESVTGRFLQKKIA